MSNSTSNLDLILSSQASKEITANSLFDAGSANMMFGRRASTTSGLTWGYYGGSWNVAGVPTQIANGTLTLTASATNYISQTNGVMAVTTTMPSGWPGPLAGAQKAVYTVITGAATVTSYTDWRVPTAGLPGATGPTGPAGGGAPTGGTTGQVLRKISGTDFDTEWASVPFDVHAFYPGKPTANAKVLRVPVARALAFPANLAGSYAIASAASTASTVFDVAKNGASVGSVTFAAAATTGTFTTAGGAAFTVAAGDRISITAPATPDATLADPGFVLAGTR